MSSSRAKQLFTISKIKLCCFQFYLYNYNVIFIAKKHKTYPCFEEVLYDSYMPVLIYPGYIEYSMVGSAQWDIKRNIRFVTICIT